MKKVLLSLLVLCLFVPAFAVDHSFFTPVHTATTVTSIAVTTIDIDTDTYGYRKIWLQNLSATTTIYIRLDSNLTIAASGFALRPGSNIDEEYNGPVYLQTESGSADLRVLELTK